MRRSPISVQAPGLGVTARMRRSTTSAGRSQRTRACSTVTLGAMLTPSAGCGTRRQRRVGDAVQRGRQQRGARNSQSLKQFPGGVGRPDRLGHDPVDRARVQARLDLKRRGAGDAVARGDGRLHRCGAAPGGQQREVQVDPAARRHRQQAVAQQRAVGHDGAAVGCQLARAPRRTRPSSAAMAAAPECRGRVLRGPPVTAPACRAVRRRRRAGSAPRSPRAAVSR